MFQVRDRLHHPAGGPGPPPGPVHVGHLQPDLVAGIVIWTTACPKAVRMVRHVDMISKVAPNAR